LRLELSDHGDVDQALLTVDRLREILLEDERAMVALDGKRVDETYVLDRRGGSWLVFFLERGRKRDFRKRASEDAACRDLLGRLRP
jgi:hypothetical protein